MFAAPRITLKPLVPTFPCFANAVVSLMEKVSGDITSVPSLLFSYFMENLRERDFFPLQPHLGFGMKVLGADIMSIPGLYRYIQVLFLIDLTR